MAAPESTALTIQNTMTAVLKLPTASISIRNVSSKTSIGIATTASVLPCIPRVRTVWPTPLKKSKSSISQQIEDTENFLEEISAIAYDKAVAVVSEKAAKDALRESTEQVDIYLDWLKEPGRKASKETVDYTTYQIITLRKNIVAAVSRLTARLTAALIKPEIKKPAVEKIKENARLSVLQKLQQRQEEINQREQTRTKPKKRSHGMEL